MVVLCLSKLSFLQMIGQEMQPHYYHYSECGSVVTVCVCLALDFVFNNYCCSDFVLVI